jgi:hypothetical protein
MQTKLIHKQQRETITLLFILSKKYELRLQYKPGSVSSARGHKGIENAAGPTRMAISFAATRLSWGPRICLSVAESLGQVLDSPSLRKVNLTQVSMARAQTAAQHWDRWTCSCPQKYQ